MWQMYLKDKATIKATKFIKKELLLGHNKEYILKEFFNKYIYGYVETIYPNDAAFLNTSIMIELIQREMLSL